MTSAAWGATLGRSVGLALLGPGDGGLYAASWLDSGRYEVDLAGEVLAVTVGTRAPLAAAGSVAAPEARR